MTETAPAANQCKPGELWYPGLHLDAEYQVPSNEELTVLWQDYAGTENVRATKDVYGVYEVPSGEISAVASVDLCEVVRDTVVSLDKATGLSGKRRGVYSKDTWFDPTKVGGEYEYSVVVSVIRAVMDSGLVEPVEDITDIKSILLQWRSHGVFVVANTSTLPGCEKGTIIHTLGRDLAGCFDGLVLPRNYDGNGSVTKAEALRVVTDEAGIDLDNMPFVHIDDMAHHIAGFQANYKEHPRIKLFTPLHADNHFVSAELHCNSPLEAFRKADAYFSSQGVIQ